MSIFLRAPGRGEKRGGTMKNVTKRLWVLLFFSVVLVTACGKDADVTPTPTATATQTPNPTPTSEAQTPKPTPTAEPEATPTTGNESFTESGGAYSVTLPDGTVLEFTDTPKRIISMGPNITDILFALGAGDRVVGRTDYCDTPKEVADIPSVGTIFTPDIEAVLALEPDLVIGSLLFSEETQKQVEDLGIKVAVLYDSENMEGVYQIIRTLGELTGLTEEGNALADQTRKVIEDTIAKYAGEEYANFSAPTVYYVSGYGESGDYTSGGTTFIGQILTSAGGKNIAQDVDGWMIAHELLLEADPQIIIIGEGMAADFRATPGYGGLSAVKNNHVFEFDVYHLLERQSHRNAEIFVQLAELFHTPLEQ